MCVAGFLVRQMSESSSAGSMTLDELEKFVTGSAVYRSADPKCISPPPTHVFATAVKRKPEACFTEEDPSLKLYQLTVNKLLTSPRRRVEPPLHRSVVMRNTLKRLECRIFVHTPRKRINLDLNEPSALSDLHLNSNPIIDIPPDCTENLPTTKTSAHVSDCRKPNLCRQMSVPAEFHTAANDSTTFTLSNESVTNNNSESITSASPQNPSIKTSEQETMDFSDIDTTETSELFKNVKLAQFEDFDLTGLNSISSSLNHSQCGAVGQLSCMKDSKMHIDELDNIMQVLVGI